MRSKRILNLLHRIAVLKRRFLPQIKLTQIYTGAQQDQMRAFRMLAHAEVENYLEWLAEDLVRSIEMELENPRAGNPYLRILATDAIRVTKRVIVENNGVTEKNILSMFRPLGFSEVEFDQIDRNFLTRMTQFGKQRGDVAHRSAGAAVYQLNRQREEAFIDEILNYLKEFDRQVEYRRRARLLDT